MSDLVRHYSADLGAYVYSLPGTRPIVHAWPEVDEWVEAVNDKAPICEDLRRKARRVAAKTVKGYVRPADGRVRFDWGTFK